MIINKKFTVAAIGFTSWCGVGFIRGVNNYKYTHYKYDNEKPFIYFSCFINGLFGIIMYANPILLPICIYKEMYRLEVDIRNLETEKKSNFYNDLI